MADWDTRISGNPCSRVEVDGAFDDAADQSVPHRRLRAEPEIAVGVLFDPLERLADLPGEDPVQPVAHSQDLAGLDIDVAGRSARATRGLVEEKSGVGQAPAALTGRRDVDQGG